MNLLFVGPRTREVGRFEALFAGGGHCVSRCDDEEEAFERYFSGKGEFDWIIVAGEEGSGLAKRLEGLGMRPPIAHVAVEDRDGARPDAAPRLLGVFEKGEEGAKLLNCVSAENGEAARASDSERSSLANATIIYEYHAPCASGKGR